MKPNLTVYKSSAGSGKTFTLSINYIAICLSNKSKDYFKRILAITFTNKAANEMKDRILGYLKNISEKTIDQYLNSDWDKDDPIAIEKSYSSDKKNNGRSFYFNENLIHSYYYI